MSYLTLMAALVLAALPSPAWADSVEISCREKYPIKNLTINFVEENTGHSPLQYLYRRCLTDRRKIEMEARRQERLQRRVDVRTNRAVERGEKLQHSIRSHVRQGVRRQQNIRSQFQTRTTSESIKTFVEERRSRRSIVGEAESYDRVNAILRRMTGQQQADLCRSVKVISGVSNPCRRYGSYR